MIEDDMTPAERERFEADLANDLPDIAEQLHGLPKTIPDLQAAIADLDQRIEHKRRELVCLLSSSSSSSDDSTLPDHVGPLRREVSRLEARRNDYSQQLSQKN